jgi:hypothetical protein
MDLCATPVLQVVVKHERLKAEANKESPPKPKRESSPKREAFNLMDLCATPVLQVVVKHERLKAEANKESPPKPKRESSPKREAFNLMDLCATSESDYDQNEDNEEE